MGIRRHGLKPAKYNILNSVDQDEQPHTSYLPVEIRPADKEKLQAAGVIFGEPLVDDPRFSDATLPAGWKKKRSDWRRWTDLLDEQGIVRAVIYYETCGCDRGAYMRVPAVRPADAPVYASITDWYRVLLQLGWKVWYHTVLGTQRMQLFLHPSTEEAAARRTEMVDTLFPGAEWNSVKGDYIDIDEEGDEIDSVDERYTYRIERGERNTVYLELHVQTAVGPGEYGAIGLEDGYLRTREKYYDDREAATLAARDAAEPPGVMWTPEASFAHWHSLLKPAAEINWAITDRHEPGHEGSKTIQAHPLKGDCNMYNMLCDLTPADTQFVQGTDDADIWKYRTPEGRKVRLTVYHERQSWLIQ